MLTEKELNDMLKEDIEDMEDDNIVNELAYYAYSYGGNVSKIIRAESEDKLVNKQQKGKAT